MFQNQFLKSGVRFLYLTWSRTILELVMFHHQLPFCFVLFFSGVLAKVCNPSVTLIFRWARLKPKNDPLLLFLCWYSWNILETGQEEATQQSALPALTALVREHPAKAAASMGHPSCHCSLPLPSLGCAPACCVGPVFFWLRDRSFFLSAFYHFYSLVLAHRIGAIIISKGKLSFNTRSFKLEPIIFATKSGAESMSPGKTSHHFHYVIISLFPIQFRGEKKKPR